jgi:hypothetical protein
MSRLIIVPSPAAIDPPHSHNIAMGDSKIMIQTNFSSTFGIPHDPVNDVLAYYLPRQIPTQTAKSQFRVLVSTFDYGWRRALAEEWVNQHCTLPVIAQPVGGSWAFWLCDGTLRRDQFYNWAGALAAHKLQTFVIELPEDQKIGLALEIDESVNELSCGKKFISHNGSTIVVSIWDETDAVEFKLKWSDYFKS